MCSDICTIQEAIEACKSAPIPSCNIGLEGIFSGPGNSSKNEILRLFFDRF